MIVQLDLFASVAPIAVTPQPSNNVAARRTEWEAFRGRCNAAVAAGKVERLLWGKSADHRVEHYLIELLDDDGAWRVRTDYALGSGGGGGPFSHQSFASRDEALVATLRGKLRQCARHEAGAWGENDAKVYQRLALWLVEQAPSPLFGGPDLVAEYAAMCAEEHAREERRGIAVRAAYDLSVRCDKALQQAGLWAFSGGQTSGLIRNQDAMDWPGAGADPEGHARAWPGEWSVAGHAPDALRVVISARKGQTDCDTLKRAVDVLRAAIAEPIEIDDREADGRPYHPIPKWTWDETAAS